MFRVTNQTKGVRMSVHPFKSWIAAGLMVLLVFGCHNKKNGNDPAATLSMVVDLSPLAKSLGDTVVIDTAKVLLKDIKFKSALDADSLDFKVGPFIVFLDLTGGVTEVVAGDIPDGIYDKIKFKIHKPEDDEVISDPDFYQGIGDDERFSIVIIGRFNGTRFVYKSKKDMEQELELNPPLVVSDTLGSVNATMLIAPANWFKKDGVYLDPTLEGNRSDIDDNIKQSFKRAYKDNDHDGEGGDDDDDDDHDEGDND